MEQKSMSIHSFKVGDLITRIEPSKPIPGYVEETRDRMYIGSPMKFLGVANGCVNLERYEKEENEDNIPSFGSFIKMVTGISGPITLPIDIWDDGWSYYVDPYSLGDKSSDKYQKSLNDVSDQRTLQKELKIALKNEEYEKAEKIRKKLDSFK